MAPDALAQVLRPLRDMFPPERFPQLLVGLGPGDDAREGRGCLCSEPVEEPRQRPGEIAVVGEHLVFNATVLREKAELQGGGSNVDSECLFNHGSLP